MEKNSCNVYIVVKEVAKSLEPRYESAVHAHTAAWWLLEKLTQQSKLELMAQIGLDLSQKDIAQLNAWISQHLDNDCPLHYVLGAIPFGPLTIAVEPPTLIPRPETEEWLAHCLASLAPVKHENLTILDMGTGSGCIALWLAKEFPNATIYAVDISEKALALAQKNAEQNNISNVIFIQSNLFDLLPRDIKFDCIFSNPPYIAPEDWNELSPTIRKWEDRNALIARNKGLEILTQLVAHAPYYIKQHSILQKHDLASLIVEIGYNQGDAVTQLFKTAGFTKARVLKDFAGHDRIVIG